MLSSIWKAVLESVYLDDYKSSYFQTELIYEN